MADERFLVTGAMGCIGAWAIRHLLDEGVPVVAADLSTDPVRPALLMTEDELARVTWIRLDVTDTAAVNRAVADNGVTHVVHLAGLQVPFCNANPPLGAAVNVVGTVNMFEAVRHNGVRGFAYASSLAAFGPTEVYPERPVPDDAPTAPTTLYGVYKVANEETARIYHANWGVSSIGLRPYTVYGVGRDQGMTADIAKAILAAATDRPFHIRFDGELALQWASDAARIFLGCARADASGAQVFNLRNDVTTVAEFVALLKQRRPEARITVEPGKPLPLPADLSDAGLRRTLGTVPHTPLAEAVDSDLASYAALAAAGRIDMTQLDR